jgi:hypothetical protein
MVGILYEVGLTLVCMFFEYGRAQFGIYHRILICLLLWLWAYNRMRFLRLELGRHWLHRS